MDIIKKILVPVDFSDFSANALKYANLFSEKINASLSVIFVIEPIVFPADFSMGQISLPSVDLDATKRSKTELNEFVTKIIPENKKVELIIKTGKPFVEINETASEIDADLIIIATHGHTGVEHLLFGGTAEKVVRKAPCPVLSLREPIKGFKYKTCK